MQTKCYIIDEDQVSHKDFGDEIVAVQFETGSYYSLRHTAATLWRCLAQGPASLAMLLACFVDPPEAAAAQIAKFVASLKAHRLILDAAEQTPAPETVTASKAVFERPEMEIFEDLQALVLADVIHETDEQGWPHIAPGNAA